MPQGQSTINKSSGTRQYFRAQAYNNAWANYRLLKACSALSQDEFEAERCSFFPSIMATLNHNLLVDRFYISALEGACIDLRALVAEEPFADCAILMQEQMTIDKRLIDVCDKLSSENQNRIIEIKRIKKTQREPISRALLHLFQHQIHHRGQVHAMLSGTNVKPPQLDEFFCSDPGEQELRKADFEALGFDEAHIWR